MGIAAPAGTRPSLPKVRALPWEVAVGLVALLMTIGPLVRGPDYVRRLTIVNPLPYTLTLDVTSEQRDAWMSVMVVSAQASEAAQDVVDQGRVWVFRAQGQGAAGGEFRVTRSELSRAGWRLRIPADVEARLRLAGAPPDPGH